MKTPLHLRFGIAAALVALAACGGGGEEDPPAPVGLQPTLVSIQANVFTPTCATVGCHTGPAAMLGLRLDPGFSYASLVTNADSFYGSGIKRVIPGDADNSFLIHKLLGTQVFGDRMPLNLAALPVTTIDVIREWIDNGAQQ